MRSASAPPISFRAWLLAERERLGRYGAVVPATQLFDLVVEKLDETTRSDAGELLTLAGAAEVCGYTADHLGTLVRNGKLTNYGRRNAPRVRRDELPIKPGLRLPLLTHRDHLHTLKAQITREARSAPRGRTNG